MEKQPSDKPIIRIGSQKQAAAEKVEIQVMHKPSPPHRVPQEPLRVPEVHGLTVSPSPARRPFHPPLWLKSVWVVLSAVATGLLLGWGILTLWLNSGGESDIATEADHPAQVSAEPQAGAVIGTQELSLFVLQGGAYSSAENAQEALQVWAARGISGVLTADSPHRIWLAAAEDRLAAEQLRNRLGGSPEVYLRPFTWHAPSIPEVPEYADAAVRFLKEALHLCGTQLTGEGELQLGQPGLEDLAHLHQSLLQAGSQARERAGEEGQAALDHQMRYATEVLEALKAYAEQGQPGLLWEAQRALLHFLQS